MLLAIPPYWGSEKAEPVLGSGSNGYEKRRIEVDPPFSISLISLCGERRSTVGIFGRRTTWLSTVCGLWSVRFDFEDQTRFSKASIASLVVDGLIAQNNVVRLGSAALGPRNYVFHRALTWFQFSQGVAQRFP